MRRDAVIPPPPTARPDMPSRAVEAGRDVILHDHGANCDFDVGGVL